MRGKAGTSSATTVNRGPTRQVLNDTGGSPGCAPLDEAERNALITVLESQRWHMTRSAEQLCISRNTRKVRKHAIRPRG